MGAAKIKENVTKQSAIESAKKTNKRLTNKLRKTNKLDEEHNKIATDIDDSINLNLKQNDDIAQTEKGQTSADNSISLSFEQNGHVTQEIYLMPIIDQNQVLQNIDYFYKSIDYLVHQCTICKEAWPLKKSSSSVGSSEFQCLRCSRDKKWPKKFSKENHMIPCEVPPSTSRTHPSLLLVHFLLCGFI